MPGKLRIAVICLLTLSLFFLAIYPINDLLNTVDIEAVTCVDGFNPFRQPHFILLNPAIGSKGADPGIAEFPVFHEVDYVRICQEITGGSNL